jgi:hypothetical protein
MFLLKDKIHLSEFYSYLLYVSFKILSFILRWCGSNLGTYKLSGILHLLIFCSQPQQLARLSIRWLSIKSGPRIRTLSCTLSSTSKGAIWPNIKYRYNNQILKLESRSTCSSSGTKLFTNLLNGYKISY